MKVAWTKNNSSIFHRLQVFIRAYANTVVYYIPWTIFIIIIIVVVIIGSNRIICVPHAKQNNKNNNYSEWIECKACKRVESILLLLLFAKLANNCLTHMQHRMYISPSSRPSPSVTLRSIYTIVCAYTWQNKLKWKNIFLTLSKNRLHTILHIGMHVYCVCRHDSNVKMHLAGGLRKDVVQS